MDLSTADRALAASFAYYGGSEGRAESQPDLTDTAMSLGREALCNDIETFADWLAGSSDERQMSDKLQYISNTELAQLLLKEGAPDVVLADAARELRKRYLADRVDLVVAEAYRALQA